MAEEVLQSYDRSEVQTKIGFYKKLFDMFWQSRKVCMPCIVLSTDGTGLDPDDEKCVGKVRKGEIVVRPIVDYIYDTNEGMKNQKRPAVKVHPIRICHGGFSIKAPIFVGDTGYLVAGDRYCKNLIERNSEKVIEKPKDISQSPNKGNGKPDLFSMNEWEYGFFVPCSWANGDGRFDDVLYIGSSSDDDNAPYIAMDDEGGIDINGEKMSIIMEDKLTLDCKNEVECIGPLRVSGGVYGKDGKDPEADLADLVETDVITRYDEEEGLLHRWHGKVLRTPGEDLEPIPIKVGGAAVDDVSLDLNSEGKAEFKNWEAAQPPLMSTIASRICKTNSDNYLIPVRVKEDGRLVLKYASIGKIYPEDGINFFSEGQGFGISSTCVGWITTSGSVVGGTTTNIKLTPTKTSGGEDGPSTWNIAISGTVKEGTSPGPEPTDTKVKMVGTDGSNHEGNQFTFAAERASDYEYSNVEVKVDSAGKMTIGVFYS